MSSVRNPSHPAGCTCLGCITPYPPEAAGTTGVRTMEDEAADRVVNGWRADHGQSAVGGNVCKCGARFYAAADFGDHLREHGIRPEPTSLAAMEAAGIAHRQDASVGYARCICGVSFKTAEKLATHLLANKPRMVAATAIDTGLRGQRLPQDPAARKAVPLATGCLDYFPDALAAVAAVSKIGNEQHNPGKPLFWDRSKSTDEADCLLRHFVDRGTLDTDGVRHSAKVAWRALALLQKEIEGER